MGQRREGATGAQEEQLGARLSERVEWAWAGGVSSERSSGHWIGDKWSNRANRLPQILQPDSSRV